ncbi:MAG: cobaltochelatase subunit CobN, partial [Methylocystis sp.]|nr:cobaltochelatase subunit CobN [Methylocystis sp.]
YLLAGGAAFNRAGESRPAHDAFRAQVARADAHVHVQDIAEVDVFTGPAFADYEGGFAAANALLGGAASMIHLDATRPDAPRARALKNEIARVIRMRLANPRWLEGQMRHGHRGGAEIAESVDNLFAFAATTGLVSDRQFDLVFDATIGDARINDFLARENPNALMAIKRVFTEASSRNLWSTRRNSVARILHDRVGAGERHEAGRA